MNAEAAAPPLSTRQECRIHLFKVYEKSIAA
jgi:hypothetical protein